MNLRFLADSPPQVADTVSNFIQRYNDINRVPLLPKGDPDAIDQLEILNGLRLWTLTIQPGAALNIDSADQGHWIYLIFDGANIVGSVRIDAGVSNKVISLEQTYQSDSFLAALYLGESHLTGDREPRWLQIFPVRKNFLWLNGIDSGDHFISLDGDGAGKVFDREELLEVLRMEYEVMAEQLRLAAESAGGADAHHQVVSVPASFVDSLPRTRLSPILAKIQRGRFVADRLYLDFSLERQQQTNWCWAAVTTALISYFARTPLSQCELVNEYYQRGDCCTSAKPCNKLEALEDILSNFNLLENDDIVLRYDLDTIKTVLGSNVKRMVCIRLFNGIGHFVVITGYDDAFVFIQDPSPHSGGSKLVEYDSLLNGSHGLWTHSFSCFDFEA